MERRTFVTCAFVGLLGVLSAALGFAAEGTKIKASDVHILSSGRCSYPRSSAGIIGLVAAVALGMAQFNINVAAACICCKSCPPGSKWKKALLFLIMSWVAFILAFLMLLGGSGVNSRGYQDNGLPSDHCYVTKPGVFSGAAILSFASVLFGIIYYVLLSTTNIRNQPLQGIVLGEPQIPSQSNPVFV